MEELRKKRVEGEEYCDEVEVDLPDCTKYYLDVLLTELGWRDGDMDINGWEGDYWEKWEKDGKNLQTCGSMYYGTCNLYLVEES